MKAGQRALVPAGAQQAAAHLHGVKDDGLVQAAGLLAGEGVEAADKVQVCGDRAHPLLLGLAALRPGVLVVPHPARPAPRSLLLGNSSPRSQNCN